MEAHTSESYQRAKDELMRFLENDPPDADAGDAWRLLGHACYQTGDTHGEIHAFVERSQVCNMPFYDLSNTANRLNQFSNDRRSKFAEEEKHDLADRLLSVLDARRKEAGSADLARMAWLALNVGQESKARDYVQTGILIDPGD